MTTNTRSETLSPSTLDKTLAIAGWLRDKKARDVVALDVSRVCSVTEVIMVASAGNPRQAKALADHVREGCREKGYRLLGLEGYDKGQWILVDVNDVVLHLFLDELRTFYNIEGLWSEGQAIVVGGDDEGEA